MKSFLPSRHLIILLQNIASVGKDFSQQLYNIGCVWEVKADNLLVCLGAIIQTNAGVQVSENYSQTGRRLNLQTATWRRIERISLPPFRLWVWIY